MTNNTNPLDMTIADLARIAHDTYYSNLRTRDDLNNYMRAELMIDADDAITSRADLIDALDRDISDLIHNANDTDLIPHFADLDDDDYDTLSRRINDSDTFRTIIADLILDRIPLD